MNSNKKNLSRDALFVRKDRSVKLLTQRDTMNKIILDPPKSRRGHKILVRVENSNDFYELSS